MQTASFATSAGWMLTGPKTNHRWAPLIAGATTRTAAHATNEPTRRTGASGRKAW